LTGPGSCGGTPAISTPSNIICPPRLVRKHRRASSQLRLPTGPKLHQVRTFSPLKIDKLGYRGSGTRRTFWLTPLIDDLRRAAGVLTTACSATDFCWLAITRGGLARALAIVSRRLSPLRRSCAKNGRSNYARTRPPYVGSPTIFASQIDVGPHRTNRP